MAVNVSGSYQAALRRQLSKEVLPLAQRYLVAYQFATKHTMEKGAGVTWTATRFNRLPLPFAPLSEGVPPIGEALTISQVTGVAIQWGDKITLSDVAVTATMYDLVARSREVLGYQIAEYRERNTYLNLVGGTQVNYVNSRGSRALIQAGDVLDTTTVTRTFTDLQVIGAPMWNGQSGTDVQKSIEQGARNSARGPTESEHYVAIGDFRVLQDLRQNATVVQAWSYSDVTRLYINEMGYWGGIHFCGTNMIPSWTGIASPGNGTAGTAGSLATNTYFIQITGTDTLNRYGETQIYQASAGVAVTGPNGSISITTPNTSGYTYSIYIGTSATVTNLATTSSASAPTSGPYTGQATQLPQNTTVVLTGTGIFQVPPAAPATGVTVYPTFVFGKEAFSVLKLEEITWTTLTEADKSDPLNQLVIIGWKEFWGVVITNQQFMARIESSASNTGTFG